MIAREQAWGSFRYIDSEGTWEVNSSGFNLHQTPNETIGWLQSLPDKSAVGLVMAQFKKNPNSIILLKSHGPSV